MMRRKPFSAIPSFLAMSRATMNMWPSVRSSSSLTSFTVGMGLLGTMSTCTGACGLMSRNAVTRSSRCTMVAGISPATIFSKMVGIGASISVLVDFHLVCAQRIRGGAEPSRLVLHLHRAGDPVRLVDRVERDAFRRLDVHDLV